MELYDCFPVWCVTARCLGPCWGSEMYLVSKGPSLDPLLRL